MIILHILKEIEWNEYKDKKLYGEKHIKSDGFIHCSDVYTVQNVVWIFDNVCEPLVLLCIDTKKVHPEIKWENGGSTDYPHIYGLLNTDAVVNVLPFLRDKDNNFMLNQELQQFIN